MIAGIDHLVLTVRDPEAAAVFYRRALGLEKVVFGEGRVALRCGDQKINLQPLGFETRNHACIGSGDVCLLTDRPLSEVKAHLAAEGIATEGPVARTGARGAISSLYFSDPEGNGLEVFWDTPWHVSQPEGILWDTSLTEQQALAWVEETFSNKPTFSKRENTNRDWINRP